MKKALKSDLMQDNKNKKYSKIVHLLLEDKTTVEIAKITGYSIGTIRNIYSELKNQYSVNTRAGIAAAYIKDKIRIVKKNLEDLLSTL